ncbi:hypothetical protein GCM10007874_01010 [Labrys miyagiensis]|uniref:Uncharacterized protein n=1 Tax=Labrys miyagiensis TaxID=346912 RepID=A0ABQ6C9X7_9HYPH|nr:hypothetical protein GCM10007874_01010 [Labrys miyagiensis]
MERDVILLDGFGIIASDLVPPGTVAIMLHGGDVKVVPAENLRATVQQLGADKIEGLSMAPSDFEKVEAVIERRKKAAKSSEE